MSKTPMTDAITLAPSHRDSALQYVPADFASDLERALNECEVALKTDYYDTLSAKRRSDALATVAKLREKYK